MLVNGCECSIVIKTAHREMDVPYSEETIREAVSVLQEKAAIEGDGVCKGIRKVVGVTGCVVTPLTLKTAPMLLYLAMGSVGKSVFVTETRDVYKYKLCLLPLEDSERFDLIQDRGQERRLYENCCINGFELRFMRGEAVKLKIDVSGELNRRNFTFDDVFEKESGERFHSDYVFYKIDGKEYGNIYGVTILCKKEGGTRTELWIKRVLENENEIPSSIEELIITAQLLRDKYEIRYYGSFRITLKRLVLVSDETDINSTDAVIAPLRFYVSGNVTTEVFTLGEGILE